MDQVTCASVCHLLRTAHRVGLVFNCCSSLISLFGSLLLELGVAPLAGSVPSYRVESS